MRLTAFEPVEVIRAELAIWVAMFADMPDDSKNRVGNRKQRSLLAAFDQQAAVLLGKMARPGNLWVAGWLRGGVE